MPATIGKQYHWDGDLLRQWRESHGRSVEHMRRHLGVSQSHYYKLETGEFCPTIYTAHRIVSLTRGAIRYRDIFLSFLPQYA